MSGMRQVVVYSRKGCHLCEIVKETLTKLHRHGGFSWQEVDVDSDAALRRQFTDEVPVVFIDGLLAQAGELGIPALAQRSFVSGYLKIGVLKQSPSQTDKITCACRAPVSMPIPVAASSTT